MNDKERLSGNVIARLTKGDWIEKNGEKVWVPGVSLEFRCDNIVTDSGDQFYAEHNTTHALAVDFHGATCGIRLGCGTTGGGNKADTDVKTVCTGSSGYFVRIQTGYPITNDSEANNTGATTDCVTWYYYFSATCGQVTKVNEGAIVNSATSPTKALAHWDFGTTFDKTTSDTLQVFVNHTFAGV